VLARRFALAREKATARREHRIAHQAVQAKLEALVVEAEALAVTAPLPTEKAWQALEVRWAASTPSAAQIPEVAVLHRRLASAGEELARRRLEADARRGEAERQNVARLEALCGRLHDLVKAESLDTKVARRALQLADE